MELLDLEGRMGLVVGIANEHSPAWSAAQHFRNDWVGLAITSFNDKARLQVEPLAREVGRVALVLASDHTSAITSEVLCTDAGFHTEGLVFH